MPITDTRHANTGIGCLVLFKLNLRLYANLTIMCEQFMPGYDLLDCYEKFALLRMLQNPFWYLNITRIHL